MAAKAKISPLMWIAFIGIDLVILGAVLIAFFWVAPIPRAFAARQTLAQARAVQPSGMVVALVTADSCLNCQMYKRGALTDPRFTAWVEGHAGAAYLIWGVNDAEIAALSVERYPATVVVAGDTILGTHHGAMKIDELIAFLDTSAAALVGAEGTEGGQPAVEPGVEPSAEPPS